MAMKFNALYGDVNEAGLVPLVTEGSFGFMLATITKHKRV